MTQPDPPKAPAPRRPAAPLRIEVDAAWGWTALALAVALVVVLGVATQFVRFKLGHARLYGFVAQFDLNGENNLPTYLGSLLALAGATLLWLIGRVRRAAGAPFARHWLGLAVVFLLLSVEETANIFDAAFVGTADLLRRGGVAEVSRGYLGGILLGVLGIAYLDFIRNLPRWARIRFVGAALLYGGSQTLATLLSQTVFPVPGIYSFRYAVLVTVEETLEYAGILLFLHVLLRLWSAFAPRPLLDLQPGLEEQGAPDRASPERAAPTPLTR